MFLLASGGRYQPGNSDGIARVNLFDYQQAGTGELFVDLTGTSLNAFDRLVASGQWPVAMWSLMAISISISTGASYPRSAIRSTSSRAIR